jgi:hypothetical protein
MAEPIPQQQLSNDGLAAAMLANARWAERLGWNAYLSAIAVAIGTADQDAGGRDFALAVAGWQASHQLSSDGVLGPVTWSAMQAALSPADSLTGLVPADAPDVPSGYAAVVSTFGDPRPLLAPDQLSITPENELIWRQQILAMGTLQFDMPGMTRPRFASHRLLVPVFEAVFREVQRLGLTGSIKSFDGTYNFRVKRGLPGQLSAHAFGIAVDLNAATNPLNGEGDMDPRLVDVFRHFGFFWGGDFHGRTDPMHFQYCTGY